ncbi:VanW family protein [Deinococcus misasensis]|uniref:VanW family protein n=1 Tax=Deinococcus misasensis TaxID=392413 RepID=UPI000557F06B|nr:VanW family protein [Deinococcus misasensis]
MKRPLMYLVPVALVVATPLVWAYSIQDSERIEKKIQVGNLDLSEKTLTEAIAALKAAPLKAPTVTVKMADKTFTVPATQLGWSLDHQETARLAFEKGQERTAFEKVQYRWGWKKDVQSVDWVVTINQDALKQQLEKWSRTLDGKPVPAKAIFSNGKYVIQADKPGQAADVQAVLNTYSGNPALTSLEIPVKTMRAAVTKESLKPLVDQANLVLRPITVVGITPAGKERTGTLGVNTVADLFWVRTDKLELDPEGIARAVKKLNGLIGQAPQNASFRFVKNQIKTVPEKTGYSVDTKAATKALSDMVLKPEMIQVEVPLKVQDPTLTLADLPDPKNLKLISSGSSTFKGSSRERSTNVKVAASALDGHVIAPDEVFSFNDAIGDISPANGYVGALVISGGRTVEGIGGGVCQVSTTTFRSMYKAGLPIVERNQHAYWVKWYAPQMGFEAAVYQPGVDLKMKNDTGAPILIRTITDLDKGTLTVNLYGIPPKRKVTVSDATILSRTPHPPSKTIYDASLAPGQMKQVDWAVDGYNVQITRTIVDSKGARKDTISSNYRPWQAVFAVGPAR